ncbi:MAG: twin-arginine translocase subunit TatC [Zoogloeaceae bacterium]|jgi:sec-independent protein translocase protein TatC|nr:twin-arginine translocase subunit TatC [Zoogloeaceae bacterium]
MSDTNRAEAEDSFISHLVELRDRLIRVVLAVVAVFLCLVYWARDLYDLLAQPLLRELPAGGQMIGTDVVGVFVEPVKVAFMTAFLIVLPYVLYQAWAFVAPGLYKHEKRFALPLLVASVALFFIGMAFAYFLVFPAVFHFMAAIAPKGVAWMTDISKYVSFVLTTFMAFGLTFEVPIVVILLVKAGLVEIKQLQEARSYVIVAAFVIAAIFTPPDVLSQLMLAIPMCLLYELGLLVARFISRPAKSEDAANIMSGAEIDAALTAAEEAHRKQEG